MPRRAGLAVVTPAWDRAGRLAPVFVIDAFGARWTLDVSGLEPALGAELLRLWARARVDVDPAAPPGDAPPFVVRRTDDGAVEVGGIRLRTTDDDIPYAVSREITMASIHRRSGQCLMLHAAGLATGDGRTVALVAASGTGKTTASRVLGRSLGYVSDETVCVEHDLSVLAYPKPLSVVVDPDAPHGKSESSPDELGLGRAVADLSLSATVVLHRSSDVTTPVLEAISLIEAMGEVLPQTSALPSLDRPLDRLATALTTGHGPWRLTYRDIADCVEIISDLAHHRFPDGLPHQVTWTWVEGGSASDPIPAPDPVPTPADGHGEPAAWRRAPFRDAVVSDGSALVMLERVPVTLPGMAAVVWLATAEPATLEDLVAATTAALGPHPDAQALVGAAVASLVESGLLLPGEVTRRGGSGRPGPR